MLKPAWDSTRHVVRLRNRAVRRWRPARREAHSADPLVAANLPSYFVDQYALLEHRPFKHLRGPLALPVRQPAGSCYLATVVQPSARLDGWRPEPDRLCDVGDLYDDLRVRWRDFCGRRGLPEQAGQLADARDLTWRRVLDGTVFYPGPPVFAGATYVDALDEGVAERLLSRVGAQGLVDFYCLMLQVHENVHRAQTGEPLLNELVQAAMWTNFLDTERLWEFQQGPEGPLVREVGALGQLPQLVDAAAEAQLDTARMTQAIAGEGAYVAVCLSALSFQRGQLCYAGYLDTVSDLFALAGQRAAYEQASSKVLDGL